MADKRIKKVLVVDDEKVIRDFLSRLLTLEDVDVTTAEGGSEAIEIVKKEKFDIIFLDMRMPQMDGVEAFKELKKITGDTKYVMMTGYSIDDLLKKVEDEKIEAFIKKPFEIDEIMAVIKEYSQQQYGEKIHRILIVEHTEKVSNLFRSLFKTYETTIVTTGREALDLIILKDFDLIFSDIMLNDMNGLELYTRIKEIKPDLDVILIMGDIRNQQRVVKECLHKQINALLR